MLVRRTALSAAGGVAAIRDRLIDDCALAARIKERGRIWLGLSETTRSLRAYRSLGEIWKMVARSAYVQLDHSPVLLLATVIGMTAVYLVPPAALAAWLAGDRWAGAIGLAAWLCMAFAYRPTLGLYREPAWRGLALPLAALLFTLMTVDSARLHWQGRGATWKGRDYGAR